MNMTVDNSRNQDVVPKILTPIKKTYIAIVLDESGSMQNMKQYAIAGFNNQIRNIQREADGNTFVSLVNFSTAVRPIFFNRTPDNFVELNNFNYNPTGWTALYDAIGYTIKRLDYQAEYADDTAFLIVIISDGMENRSQEFNRTSIGDLIRSKQSTNRWTFTYIGANQDLSKVIYDLGIPPGNIMSWVYTPEGTSKMFVDNTISVSCYMNNRRSGLTSSKSFYSDSSKNPTITPLNVTTFDSATKTIVDSADNVTLTTT